MLNGTGVYVEVVTSLSCAFMLASQNVIHFRFLPHICKIIQLRVCGQVILLLSLLVEVEFELSECFASIVAMLQSKKKVNKIKKN